MHSPNVVRLVMAESGRGQEVVVTPIPDFPEKNGALATPPKNNLATASYRAVSISFYFQGQGLDVNTTLSIQIIRQHILYYRLATN